LLRKCIGKRERGEEERGRERERERKKGEREREREREREGREETVVSVRVSVREIASDFGNCRAGYWFSLLVDNIYDTFRFPYVDLTRIH